MWLLLVAALLLLAALTGPWPWTARRLMIGVALSLLAALLMLLIA
jgi:hypothetical protein